MTDDIRILKDEQIQKKNSRGSRSEESTYDQEGLRLGKYYQHPFASRRQRK